MLKDFDFDELVRKKNDIYRKNYIYNMLKNVDTFYQPLFLLFMLKQICIQQIYYYG